MANKGRIRGADGLEEALKGRPDSRVVLRLYVAGLTPRSSAAVERVKDFCETFLGGRYDLEVIDIYQQPELSEADNVLAAPTLIKKLPLPLRRFIGDMSDENRLLIGLDLVLDSSARKDTKAAKGGSGGGGEDR